MKNQCDVSSIIDSPLLRKMANTIAEYGAKVSGIWVSISREGENYQPDDEEHQYWVKWLSWSLIDEHGEELFEPYLAVVHGDLSEQQVNQDLENYFGEYKIQVDNEIYFED